jgi:predicted MFS family arabinose efflux permease
VALLLSAALTTQMSNVAQTTVLGLLIYRRTGSELDLGFLGLAEFAPAALLVLVAGATADRFDRRRVAAFSGLTNAVVALAMALYVHASGHGSTTPIFLLVLAFGVGQAFLAPSQRSIPSSMVSGEVLPWLTARRSVASQVGSIIGPVIAGVLYGSNGVWPLVGAAVLSATGALLTLGIHLLPSTEAASDGAEFETVSHVLEEGIPAPRGGVQEAMEGLRLVRRNPVLLGAISLDLFAVLLGGAITLLPAIAVRLHVGAVGLGWLRAAAGLGAGLMTLFISFRPVRRHVGNVLFSVVAIFGVWTIVLGITHSYALAFIAILALSAADAVSMFIRSTLVPLATPPEMRGRVLAVENVFIGASNELGGFESGAMGQLLGTSGSVVLGGVGTLVVAVTWALIFTPLRKIDRFPTSSS